MARTLTSNGFIVKWQHVIRQLRAYIDKNGQAHVYWDWAQNGPRPRMNGTWQKEATLIGVYDKRASDQQIVDDIETHKKDLGLRSRPERRYVRSR